MGISLLFSLWKQGSGASLPAKVYKAWAAKYGLEKRNTVTYHETDSVRGVNELVAGKVDFAASDFPLRDAELRAKDLIQFPAMVGGIVPVASVKARNLRLSGAVLAQIFMGEITNWDDSRIKNLNPGIDLSGQKIHVLVREPDAGTTEIFTNYLFTQNSTFSRVIGLGKAAKWKPDFEVVRSSDAMLQTLKTKPGSIGYLGYDRAREADLSMLSLSNASGHYVKPSEASFTAAIKAAKLYKSFSDSASLINLTGDEAWPIIDMSYVLMQAKPKNASRATSAGRFFYWVLLKEENLARGTGFVALPDFLQAYSSAQMRKIKMPDGKLIDL